MNKAPEWFCNAVGASLTDEKLCFPAATYCLNKQVWETTSAPRSPDQSQTEQVFGYKWKQEDSFSSTPMLSHLRSWLVEKYGESSGHFATLPKPALVLDAGCGAAMSALEFLGPVFQDIHYIGVDVSEAVHVAAKRVHEHNFTGVFLQEDLTRLPFAPNSVDCIFSEGVLHHTDSTRDALAALTPLLKPQGLFIFYVYRQKGPVREFTDDYIRAKIQDMSPEAAWQALKPLTEFGIALGKLNQDIEIAHDIPLLEIPAGKISLQRFFYWHICKMFYRPDLTFDEMQHINFDWFAPRNAHRQQPEDVQQWCQELGLHIERMHLEQAGISIVARKI